MTATIHRHHSRDWGLSATDRPGGWRDDAQCVNYDPAWWDLIGTGLTQENQQAIRICHRCPVTTECNQLAIDTAAVGVVMAGLPRYGRGDEDTTVWHSYTCQHCQRIFTRCGSRREWRYCSPYCKQAHNDQRYRSRRAAELHPQAVDKPVDNVA